MASVSACHIILTPTEPVWTAAAAAAVAAAAAPAQQWK